MVTQEFSIHREAARVAVSRVTRWLQDNSKCPMCRFKFQAGEDEDDEDESWEESGGLREEEAPSINSATRSALLAQACFTGILSNLGCAPANSR